MFWNTGTEGKGKTKMKNVRTKILKLLENNSKMDTKDLAGY